MPKYVGKGATFYLVSCELLPSAELSSQRKEEFFRRVCQKCGFYKDSMKRVEKAVELDKKWRRLVCIHPQNREAWRKWKPHVTVWGR